MTVLHDSSFNINVFNSFKFRPWDFHKVKVWLCVENIYNNNYPSVFSKYVKLTMGYIVLTLS